MPADPKRTGSSALRLIASVFVPVEMVSVELSAVLVPSSRNDAGEKEHFERAGSPLQFNVTVSVKPFAGLTMAFSVAVDDLPTLRELADTDMLKSGCPLTRKTACAEVRPELFACM